MTTNTICQGGQVPVLWSAVESLGIKIAFAYTSFKWANLASHNAGITVIVVGLRKGLGGKASLFDQASNDVWQKRDVDCINGYLIAGPSTYVSPQAKPLSDLPILSFGNHPYYGADLIISSTEVRELLAGEPQLQDFVRPYYGSTEVIKGVPRYCIWVRDAQFDQLPAAEFLTDRFEAVREARLKKSADATARSLADKPYRFRDQVEAKSSFIAVPQVTSENRQFLPCDLMTARPVVSFKCFAMNDAPVWAMSIVASSLHLTWIATVCGRMRTDFSYSNTMGWNTFPVPTLTDQNKADLTRCAEDILLAREAHFPATIADLYDPDAMPEDLRAAHERNDEVLERIYIGRRFRNDTERLEKLFELYTKMTAKTAGGKAA